MAVPSSPVLLQMRRGWVAAVICLIAAPQVARADDQSSQTSYGQKIETAGSVGSIRVRRSLAACRALLFCDDQLRPSRIGREGETHGFGASWPTSRGRWTKSCWRETNIWLPKTAS
jgi:hypothetical protein